jgi:coenzyme F420-reducing hydrogenase beta subunit
MSRAAGFDGNCTGCGACYAICRHGAINISINDKGFFTASVTDNCIDCGRCSSVCIVSQREIKHFDFQNSFQYSAYLKDEMIHQDCASGGAAYGLYKKALLEGYKAIGTYYSVEKNKAVTVIADSLEDANKFRGSKYLQSDHAEAIYTAINSNERYIVCGTPCEVYGYRLAAKFYKCEERFIFIDFFCHGVPSYLAWNQYLEEVTQGEAVTNVSFRDHKHGWRKNYITVKSGGKVHSCERSKDHFYHIFDDSYLMAECCYTCNMCQRYGCSDIRIGDLWDASLCQDGVFRSLVCIGTERGGEFWNGVKDLFITQNIERVLPEKNAIPERYEIIRAKAFDDLAKGNKPLKKVIRRYRNKESLKRHLQRNAFIVKVYITLKKKAKL